MKSLLVWLAIELWSINGKGMLAAFRKHALCENIKKTMQTLIGYCRPNGDLMESWNRLKQRHIGTKCFMLLDVHMTDSVLMSHLDHMAHKVNWNYCGRCSCESVWVTIFSQSRLFCVTVGLHNLSAQTDVFIAALLLISPVCIPKWHLGTFLLELQIILNLAEKKHSFPMWHLWDGKN